MRPEGTPEELERRRRRAVALVEDGWAMRAAAQALDASPGSVSKWYAAYKQGGDDALAAQPHPGRPSELTDRQLKRLGKLLRKGPTRCGFPTELWTLKRVAALIEKEFGLRYDPSGVWHILKRIGWRCHRAVAQARLAPDKKGREDPSDRQRPGRRDPRGLARLLHRLRIRTR